MKNYGHLKIYPIDCKIMELIVIFGNFYKNSNAKLAASLELTKQLEYVCISHVCRKKKQQQYQPNLLGLKK